jgi:crossover junction endodeoxyribonuclease RusA
MIELQLAVPPSANRWWRNVNGRMVTSREARDYKRYVAEQCGVHRIALIQAPTPVCVTIIWWRERKAGDLDKRLGVVLDALQGSAYDNDAQIVELHATRHDATSTQPPGLVVKVREAA